MDIRCRARQHSHRACRCRLLPLLLVLGTALHAQSPPVTTTETNEGSPTVAEASSFIQRAEARLLDLWIKQGRAQWVAGNFITEDTEAMAADADQAVKAATAELAHQARRFDPLRLPPDVARKFMLLRLSVSVPAPRDPAAQAELARISASLEADYGKGTWCPDDPDEKKGNCKPLPDLERILAQSRDPQEMLAVWQGWHAIARPMRERYARLVELGNRGAQEMEFADMGAMWHSNYDMPEPEFSKELDRLWHEVRPLYLSLHAYVRWKLAETYGQDVVSEDQPIPAHVLGNMWAQEWTNLYPLLAPANAGTRADLTAALRAKNVDAIEMVKYGEGFFTSLGFAPLPQTFWERSLFVKPRDRDVICHASAWDIDFQDDLRVKMCIEVSASHFTTIHHELGHNFYERAYNHLSPLFQDSANDGFHEAIGDTMVLSVTPEYLQQIGLIAEVPSASGDTGLLLQRALGKVAFLPFGLFVDQWRRKVFSGEVKPAGYNQAWWDLRRAYQGVAPPVPRTEADFDPGAKYHVAANVPYTRYFLATILQFQFHRALCREAGYTGPLHRCSIYYSKAGGRRLARMLSMGRSRPWPEALEVLTGEKRMDASAILDYFAPLKKWLDEQNAGHPVGWN